jgi:hypothetical protein
MRERSFISQSYYLNLNRLIDTVIQIPHFLMIVQPLDTRTVQFFERLIILTEVITFANRTLLTSNLPPHLVLSSSA